MIPEYKLFGMHENVGYMTCVLHTDFQNLHTQTHSTKHEYEIILLQLLALWINENVTGSESKQKHTTTRKKISFGYGRDREREKKVYVSHITTTTEEQLNTDESIFAHGNTSRDTECACWVNSLYCNIMSRQKEKKKNYDEILILSHTHMSII